MRNDTARWLSPGDADAISGSLATRFAQEFGTEAEGVWFAPGRANLNGEHIDFHGGRCLPMALPLGTFVAAAARDDGQLRLRTLDPSLDSGAVLVPQEQQGPHTDDDDANNDAPDDEVPDDEAPGWTRYVSGVLWSMREAADADDLALTPGFGADVLIRSTLPIGAGLSSSASLECAAAMAFTALGTPLGQENAGEELGTALRDAHRATLASACMRAEMEVVGAGTGGLDQTTSMRAADGKLLSLDCRDFTVKRVDVSFLLRNYRFLAVDTGQPHQLLTSEFSSRRAESEAAAALLEVPRLRDALPAGCRKRDVEGVLEEFDRLAEGKDELNGHDPAACRRRLKHAVTEMLRSEKINALLTGEGYGVDQTASAIGDMMTAGHLSMRDMAEVSFDLADTVVDTALTQGALGARLIGGGFGGSVLMLAHRQDVDRILGALAKLSAGIRFLEVTPSAGARPV